MTVLASKSSALWRRSRSDVPSKCLTSEAGLSNECYVTGVGMSSFTFLFPPRRQKKEKRGKSIWSSFFVSILFSWGISFHRRCVSYFLVLAASHKDDLPLSHEQQRRDLCVQMMKAWWYRTGKCLAAQTYSTRYDGIHSYGNIRKDALISCVCALLSTLKLELGLAVWREMQYILMIFEKQIH